MPSTDPHLRIVILAGGIGSRFWPASTPRRPKQLLPLASRRPLIVDTVERALLLAPRERIRILAGRHLVEPFRRALSEVDEELFWVEPAARGTGPVLAWAARRILREDPEGVMVSLHSDHFIDPPGRFEKAISRAVSVARREDLLVTMAVKPDRPETGYGYVRPGHLLGQGGEERDARRAGESTRGDRPSSEARYEPESEGEAPRAWRLGAFIEKPDFDTARRYVEEGYLWNSGIFVWKAARFLDEVRAHAPEIAEHLPLLESDDPGAFFEQVTQISVDEAVLERSDRVGTVEATFRWDDVGDWNSLARTRVPDRDGNVVEGEASLVDAKGNVVWAEDGPVVLFGVEELVVARSAGVTLVAPRARAAQLKELVKGLPEPLQAPRGEVPPEQPSDPVRPASDTVENRSDLRGR